MLCAKLATRRDGFKFPCGQCQNCKINKRRDWQARLLLEAASHEYGIFVTLTMADVGTPQILSKAHLKPFFNSLRTINPAIRFYAVGEYGTNTGRAHYHAHLFSNIPILAINIREAWPYGRIHVGDTEPSSLDYCLGYLLKNTKTACWPIEARWPEFRYYSKGIGKFALPHLLIDGTELSREFKVFGRTWPIGRYLRDRAKKMGFTISEREAETFERLEAKQLRSLLIDKKITHEEARNIIIERNKKQSETLQKKAIRAAYLQQHGHLNRKKHETF